MADTKISALTALTGANVDETADVLPIVDTSVTTTKKILVSELFTLTGASPQITLGKLNTTSGGIKFFGSTSGNVTLAPNVAAGASVTVTLPATSVTLNAAGDLTGNTLAAGVTASSLTSVGANLTVGSANTGNTLLALGDNTAGQSRLRLYATNLQKGWEIGASQTVANALEFTPATAAGGTTFSTPILTLNSTGAITMTGALTAASLSTGSGAISGGAISGTTGTFTGNVNDATTKKQYVTIGTGWTTLVTVDSISGNWQGVVAVVKLANPMNSGSAGTVTYSLALVNGQTSVVRATTLAGSDMTAFVQVTLGTSTLAIQIRGDSADATSRTYAEITVFGATLGTSGQPTLTWS